MDENSHKEGLEILAEKLEKAVDNATVYICKQQEEIERLTLENEHLKNYRNKTLVDMRSLAQQIYSAIDLSNPFSKQDEWYAHQLWCILADLAKHTDYRQAYHRELEYAAELIVERHEGTDNNAILDICEQLKTALTRT